MLGGNSYQFSETDRIASPEHLTEPNEQEVSLVWSLYYLPDCQILRSAKQTKKPARLGDSIMFGGPHIN